MTHKTKHFCKVFIAFSVKPLRLKFQKTQTQCQSFYLFVYVTEFSCYGLGKPKPFDAFALFFPTTNIVFVFEEFIILDLLYRAGGPASSLQHACIGEFKLPGECTLD